MEDAPTRGHDAMRYVEPGLYVLGIVGGGGVAYLLFANSDQMRDELSEVFDPVQKEAFDLSVEVGGPSAESLSHLEASIRGLAHDRVDTSEVNRIADGLKSVRLGYDVTDDYEQRAAKRTVGVVENQLTVEHANAAEGTTLEVVGVVGAALVAAASLGTLGRKYLR
ncbi:MAG: hypothetical protein QF824_00910 [Candidatus Woesearchaeota archaeon]|jgi:hypothetical protein|nr:hypothetical protein [Candidatus Woesearchaeota archaeon]